MDGAFAGLNTETGQVLFDAEGKPAELLQTMQKQLESLEAEIQRTRLVGKRLQELDLRCALTPRCPTAASTPWTAS